MTMRAKDIRQFAWQSLSGKWGICVIIFLLYDIILGASGGLSMLGIGAVLTLIIAGPLELGYTKVSYQVVKGEKPEIMTLFDGFKDFARSLVLYITNNLLVFAWSLLLIVPGIIKSYAYSMSFYVLLDNPDMTANDARKRSIELMDGNKWRLFCLQFSFIGWYLLCILTFGILTFWVTPYVQVATAKFYLELLPEDERVKSAVGEDGDVTVDNSSVNDFDAFANGESQKQDFSDDFDFKGEDEFK